MSVSCVVDVDFLFLWLASKHMTLFTGTQDVRPLVRVKRLSFVLLPARKTCKQNAFLSAKHEQNIAIDYFLSRCIVYVFLSITWTIAFIRSFVCVSSWSWRLEQLMHTSTKETTAITQLKRARIMVVFPKTHNNRQTYFRCTLTFDAEPNKVFKSTQKQRAGYTCQSTHKMTPSLKLVGIFF